MSKLFSFCPNQGWSEHVCYFAERVLNIRSDQKIKNAFVSFCCICLFWIMLTFSSRYCDHTKDDQTPLF